MKKHFPNSSHIFRNLTIILLLVLPPVHAAVLIEIDIRNPASIVFTATSNHSSVNDSSSFGYDGVTLLNLFETDFSTSGDFGVSADDPTAMRASGSAFPYLNFYNGGEIPGSRYLTFWTGNTPQTFSTEIPAFSGFLVPRRDFSNANFRASGITGDIIVGNTLSGQVIGQWQIIAAVPEPCTSILLLGAGILALVSYRRLVRKN